jgi:lipopolysaccharide export system protein LptA
MYVRGFTSAIILLLGGAGVSAAQPPNRPPGPPADIVITSQSLAFKNQEHKAIFEGRVVMKKGEFTMHADQMVVHFDETPPAPASTGSGKAAASPRAQTPDLPTFGNRGVALIESTGNVLLEQGDKKARSKKALYYQREEKLVLTGDPEVWEAGYRVTGTKMTMFLKEDRSVVEGSRVVINEVEPAPR